VLVYSLLVSCSHKLSSGTPDSPGIGFYQRDYQFSADWPDNNFTELLPKPPFEVSLGEPSEMEYTIVCDATVDQLKEYVESLKAAGFTIGENTAEENAFGVSAYSFTASNEEGYTVEVNYSNTLGSLSTLTLKKLP